MQVPAPRRPSFSREEADPALWPYVTSHHREWLFSAEALAEKRAAVYGVAVEKLKLAAASAAEREPKNAACAEVEGEGRRDAGSDVKNKGEDSTRKSVVETPQQMELAGAEGVEAVARAPPTLEELLQVQQYFAMQLLTIFKEKGVKPAALEAACCFFHRFFLGTSLLEFDVRLVLFVCVILALKATDVARHFTLGELLGDIEELDVAAVVDLELPVCAGLNYQLLCLTTAEPLNELVHILVEAQQQRFEAQLREAAAKAAAAESGRKASNNNNPTDLLVSAEAAAAAAASRSAQQAAALDSLEEQHLRVLHFLVKLQEAAENDCLLMHASPHLPLRFPPATLACAAVMGSPLKKQLLALGLDVEAVLRQRLTGDEALRKESGFSQTASAEAQWKSTVQSQVKQILVEVQQLRAAKQQMHLKSGANNKMAQLLLRVIEAEEVRLDPALLSLSSSFPSASLRDRTPQRADRLEVRTESAQVLKAHADADSHRTRKKRRKAKKAKKEPQDTAAAPVD